MTNQKNLWAATIVLSALLAIASPAKANSYSFDFMSSDHTYGVNAIITTANTANSIWNGSSFGYTITGITGNVTGLFGGAINSLVSGGPNMITDYGIGFMYDNVAFPTPPRLDIGGVLFTTGAGKIWNLWGNSATGPGNYELFSWTAAGGSVGNWSAAIDKHGDLTVTSPVPEPQTYLMLLAGLGLMGFVARRRQRDLAA